MTSPKLEREVTYGVTFLPGKLRDLWRWSPAATPGNRIQVRYPTALRPGTVQHHSANQQLKGVSRSAAKANNSRQYRDPRVG